MTSEWDRTLTNLRIMEADHIEAFDNYPDEAEVVVPLGMLRELWHDRFQEEPVYMVMLDGGCIHNSLDLIEARRIARITPRARLFKDGMEIGL